MRSDVEEDAVRVLYQQLLDSWNQRSAAAYAALLMEDGTIVGFDGSEMRGRSAVEAELGRIFADHQTAPYLGIVREVRLLGQDAALLRAVAGMVPPGGTDINPAVNAIHVLVAAKTDDRWRIAHFQNTPAQFHGRPELVQQLTDELRQLLPR